MSRNAKLWVSAVALTVGLSWSQVGFAGSGRMLHLQDTEPNWSSPPNPAASSQKASSQKAIASQAPSSMARSRSASLRALQAGQPGRVAQNSQGPGCRIRPASPAIGADVPETYFGPAPATVNPSLVGPVLLLTAGEVNTVAETITLPLYRGELRQGGRSVWYILTDTTDEGNAAALGLNFAAKLNFAATGRGVRTATLLRDGLLVFDSGTVDFTPQREVVPGGDGTVSRPAPPFPPQAARPGSMGDVGYTPLVRIVNAGGHIYNAPIVAFDVTAEQIHFPNGNPDYALVHDKVVAIDTVNDTVTLALTPGFSFARPVLYISTEASVPDVAALEGATFAPGLQDIETGNDDSAFSAVERIFVVTNGATGCENPQRQGLDSAISDGRGPFNVLGGIPTLATDYSPLWDVNLGTWTQDSIRRGYRSRLLDEFQILGLVEAGFITGPGGADYGSVGAIVNCPIVFRFL